MTDEQFMQIALQEAKKAGEAKGLPFASIVVKDNNVIATGWSVVGEKLDPSAHNDIDAIRNACKALQTVDLSGCTLYSTIEMCAMCLTCSAWANVSRIVFGAYIEDIPANPYGIENYHAQDYTKQFTHKIEITGGVLQTECTELMKGVINWQMK